MKDGLFHITKIIFTMLPTHVLSYIRDCPCKASSMMRWNYPCMRAGIKHDALELSLHEAQ